MSPSAPEVTPRERDVLGLVASHLTNAEIADRLSLSVRTIESHLSSLIRKLEVPDRRALARRADELGLLGSGGVVTGLPATADRFIGRAAETAALRECLGLRRLVTVTGPGGVGKTRLASHVVRQLASGRPQGGWFVDLSQVVDAAGAVRSVASVTGVAERPGESLHRTLVDTLTRADGILVLDNCEHLLPGLEDVVASLVSACPRLTVLATSRVPLRTPSEWVVEVPGLVTPDAIELFQARAEAAGRAAEETEDLGQVCERLDGMPLAIELAAARYPALGMDGLSVGLSEPLRLLGSADRRSLRATIGWSVDLLPRAARPLLAALSVFAAPFTMEATRAVCCPDRSSADVASLLATLVDHHLLHVEVGQVTRYRLQEVVRQYADELLGEDTDDVRERHAVWAEHQLMCLGGTPHDDRWCADFDRLAPELEAALAHAPGHPGLAERYAEELVLRGRLEEAQRRFEGLASSSPGDRVRLLLMSASTAVARLVGDEGIRLLDAAAEAALTDGRPEEAAEALAWSAIYAAFHPGTMADPPDQSDIDRRVAQARGLAPVGSVAEATVAAAVSMCLADDDPRAEPQGRAAAARAAVLGRPLLGSAALDRACAAVLARGDYAGALADVRARGTLMDPLPLSAATAYAFNDYLLMGCEVSLAAGDLPSARTYAERLSALDCYRDYRHPALARRLEVDALVGDFAGAVERGDAFLASWERAGRHRAPTLGIGTYALATIHGMVGDEAARATWLEVTATVRGAPVDGLDLGWAPTLDAWRLLHQGDPHAALRRLATPLDDPAWTTNTTWLMWRPWYAAALAEASALAGQWAAEPVFESERRVACGNLVTTALVERAHAIAAGDHDQVLASAAVFAALGTPYQCERSRVLSRR